MKEAALGYQQPVPSDRRSAGVFEPRDRELDNPALEHLPVPLGHLLELARVTRPGELLLLTTPNLNGVSGRWLGIRWRVIDPEHLGYFISWTLSCELQQAGYRDIHVASRSLDVVSGRRGTGPVTSSPVDRQAGPGCSKAVAAKTLLWLGRW